LHNAAVSPNQKISRSTVNVQQVLFGVSVSATKQDAKATSNHNRQVQIQEMRHSFISSIIESLKDETFVSLVFQGPPKQTRTKKSQKMTTAAAAAAAAILDDEELLRGCMKQVSGRRIKLKDQQFLQMTFKYHLATDIVKNWPMLEDRNLEDFKDALETILDPFQQGITRSRSTNKNIEMYVPLSEWGSKDALVRENSEQQFTKSVLGIQKGVLATTSHTLELDVAYATQNPRLKHSKFESNRKNVTAVVDEHDRIKNVPLDTKAGFLQALGVTDTNGKPKRAMASKLRQCQKFVEIVGNLVSRATSSASDNTVTPVVMDMGCGRGYLTFSLHSYLCQKFETVKSVGFDVRPKLVAEMNDITKSLGEAFGGVSFEEGSIEQLVLDVPPTSTITGANEHHNMLDILIALHACDTATDDALWCGISRQVDIIVVAPCCHKEVRPQLNAHLGGKQQHPLADMLRHNVYRERHAEMVTDSMRALLLELAGYQVQVFEFIGGEHTAKNVMITAVRLPTCKDQRQQQTALQSRLNELASLNGIQNQKLARWMGSSYLGDNSPLMESRKERNKARQGRMPPL